MNRFHQLAQQNPQWSLEEFVQVVNNILPDVLPHLDRPTRIEEINPRLVRYYTTQQLIDKPLKQGREARYTYHHLLQLLVVRRLLTEGFSTGAITSVVSAKTDSELEALLQGGIQLTVETANPALAYLQRIQQRSAPMPPSIANASGSDDLSALRSALPAAPPPSPVPKQWSRVEILPGLELHIQEDFVYPSSSQERQNLLQLIAHHLSSLFHRNNTS